MRQDEDAKGSRRLDEACGGDRLSGRCRVTEAEPPDGARIRLHVLDHLDLAVLRLFLVDLGECTVLQLGFGLVGGNQLRQHPGERVDLVAAKLGAGPQAGEAAR